MSKVIFTSLASLSILNAISMCVLFFYPTGDAIFILVLCIISIIFFFTFRVNQIAIIIFFIAFFVRLVWAQYYFEELQILAEKTALSDAIDYRFFSSLMSSSLKEIDLGDLFRAHEVMYEYGNYTYHVFYYYYAAMIQYFLQELDFAVQIMDMFISSLSVVMLISIARNIGIRPNYAMIGGLIFALMPSHIFFSAAFHKDVLLTFLILLANMILLNSRIVKGIIKALPVMVAITFTRIYYLPIILVSHWMPYLRKRGSVIAVVLLVVVLGVALVNYLNIGYIISKLTKNWDYGNPLLQLIVGSIKYVSPALPWKLQGVWDNFLIIANSLFWLVTLPIWSYGFYRAITIKKYKKWIIWQFIFLLIIAAFMANVQGVRHRLQIEPLLIIFFIIGLEKVVNIISSNIKIMHQMQLKQNTSG